MCSHSIYILGTYICFATSLNGNFRGWLFLSIICEAFLYAYYIHIYFFKQIWTENQQWSLFLSTIMWSHLICILYTHIFFYTILNRKLATSTVFVYYSVKLLYMHIIYMYMFWNKEISNSHCPYQLLCKATSSAYWIHIYFFKEVWTGNWER